MKKKKENKNTVEATSNPPTNSTETPSPTNERTTSNKSFTEEELGAFQSKGLMKVKKLMDYLEVIAQNQHHKLPLILQLKAQLVYLIVKIV
ncbi:MAG: hypothetical protein IPI10_08745 [Bacteroidetes bacterium]|nr:hypothetical protein [Bacteroidota bacterium]